MYIDNWFFFQNNLQRPNTDTQAAHVLDKDVDYIQSFFKKWHLFNRLFRITAIGLILGGAAITGYGAFLGLASFTIPIGVIAGGITISILIWLITSAKPIYNKLASWGTWLDGSADTIDKAGDILKQMNKISSKLNREVEFMNQEELKMTRFKVRLAEVQGLKRAKADELAQYYLESSTQQNERYKEFNILLKQIKKTLKKSRTNLAFYKNNAKPNRALIRNIEDIFYQGDYLAKRGNADKIAKLIKQLSTVDFQLSQKLQNLYIYHREQENEINQKYLNLINTAPSDSTVKSLKASLAEIFTQSDGAHYFIATPYEARAARAEHLQTKLRTKAEVVKRLLEDTVVYDEENSQCDQQSGKLLEHFNSKINQFFNQLSMLRNAYLKLCKQLALAKGKNIKQRRPSTISAIATTINVSEKTIFESQTPGTPASTISITKETVVTFNEKLSESNPLDGKITTQPDISDDLIKDEVNPALATTSTLQTQLAAYSLTESKAEQTPITDTPYHFFNTKQSYHRSILNSPTKNRIQEFEKEHSAQLFDTNMLCS